MQQKYKGLLLEQLLKLLISLAIFVGLIFLGIKLYGMITENTEEMQAKATLEQIKQHMERAKEEGETSLLIYAPKGWKILFFPKNLNKISGIEKPALFFDESIVCITKGKECKKYYFVVNESIKEAKIEITKVYELVLKFSENQYIIELNSFDISYKDLEEKERKLSENIIVPSNCSTLKINFYCKGKEKECDVKNIRRKWENVIFKNNDNGTEYINPALNDTLIELDKKISEINKNKTKNIKIVFTDGYSVDNDHISDCHMVYGTCFDVVILKQVGNSWIIADNEDWEDVINIARELCLYVYDEREKLSKEWTAPHLHLDRCWNESYCEMPPIA
jgi:hypothetical protein